MLADFSFKGNPQLKQANFLELLFSMPTYFGIPRAKASFTLFCSLCYAVFILVGALVFQYFEEENEIKVCTGIEFQMRKQLFFQLQ